MATTIEELKNLCEDQDLDEVRKGVEQCLALGIDINDPSHGLPPLHQVCCRRGHRAEFVSCLLECGADPNVVDRSGDTALHIVTVRNDVESAKLLLAHGANPSVVGTWGQTVLHRTAFSNYVQLLELFVDAGSDMTIRDDKYHTPLHTAADEDSLGAIEFLVQRGADINTRDRVGRAPLHDATADSSHKCRLETVRLLLQLGADPNARDNEGRSVLEHHLSQVHRLSEFDIEQGKRDDSDEVLRLLVDYGANVSATHQAEVSPLHVLARNVDPPLGSFDALLERGAPINALNQSGQTVLHVFSSNQDRLKVGCIELLLSRGAQDALVIEDADGNLPLHSLVANVPRKFDFKHDASMLLTLLKAGADANLRNRDGMSPMSLLLFFRARTKGSSMKWRDKLENAIYECSKVLCSHGATWDDSCERRLVLLQQLWKPPNEDGSYDNSDLLDVPGSDEEEDAMAKQTKEVVASWMTVIKLDQEERTRDIERYVLQMSEQVSPAFLAKRVEEKKTEDNIPSPVLLLSALRGCIRFWTEERARGGKDVKFTDVPREIYSQGEEYVTSWLKDLQESTAAQRVSRSKICVVGASEWGKTSLVKSLTLRKPSLVHVDDRTIGIDLFSCRFQEAHPPTQETSEDIEDSKNDDDITVSTEPTTTEPEPKNHEVTFWDFAGQDVYQAAHALFFSKRTLYLLCVDLERYVAQLTTAQQLSDRACDVVMRRYVTTHVIKWLETILARQVDAEFVLVATKADTVRDPKQIKAVWVDLQIRLGVWREEYATTAVKASVNDQYAPSRQELVDKLQRAIHGQWLVVSSVDQESVEQARQMTESTVVGCKKGFVMGKKYSRVRQAILDRRGATSQTQGSSSESDDAADERDKRRVENLIVPSSWLIRRLCMEVEDLEPDECVVILRTLSQLGDILWYEHRSAGALRDCVILDPLLVLDIVREVITHDVGRSADTSKQLTEQEQKEQEEMTRAVRSEGRLSHKLLRGRPLWRHLDDELTASFKSLLQYFQLAYPAREREAAHDSDLIVPAYWKLSLAGSGEASETAPLPSIREVAPDQPVYLAWEYVMSSSIAPTLFDQFAVQSYSPIFDRTISRQTITSTENDGDFVSRILVVPFDMTTEAIRIETAASDVDSAWLKLRFFVMMMEQVLEEYSGLYVMRDVVQVDQESGEETRHRVSLAVHDIKTYAKMGKDATELVAKRPWLPSDMLRWFIEKAWRHSGRLQEIQSRAFVRRMLDQASVLQKLVVRGEKGRLYPSLWTVQYDETDGVVKLQMLSDLSGVCYHTPLVIPAPSQFWAKHGTAIESGLWVFSNVIPEILTLGVVQKVIDTAAPVISGVTQRAQAVHCLIDRLDLSSQGVSTSTTTSTSLSSSSARALLRDLLTLNDASFDELRVGELSNLQCAVSPSGSYVWAHPQEIKAIGGNKLTPCDPDYSAVMGAHQQEEKPTKGKSKEEMKEETTEDPSDTKDEESQIKLTLTFEGLEGVSAWNSHKVFCSWQLVHDSQQATPLAVGSTEPNGYKASDAAATAASGAMVTWSSRTFEVVGVVSSVAMLHECRLEVQVKRASRLLGQVKDLGHSSQPLIGIMAADDKSLDRTLVEMPVEIAGSKATISCTMAVETTSTESSAPQAL